MSETPLSVIRAIKKTYENTIVFTGTAFGLILLIYFFSFAQLFDRGYWGLMYFQIISSIFLVLGLIMLRRVAFFLTKLIYGRHPEHSSFLAGVTVSEISQDEKTLLGKFHA